MGDGEGQEKAAIGGAAGKAAERVVVQAVNEEVRRRNFLFGIPVQIGPPKDLARNLMHWFEFILLLQVAACLMRFFILVDIFGALWMLGVVALGVYAWKEKMNITYLCFWGLGCAVNAVFDTLALTLPMFLPFVYFKFNLFSVIVKIAIPVSEMLGAALAWHLYSNYMEETDQVGIAHKVARYCDPLGATFDKMDPTEKILGKANMEKANAKLAQASSMANSYASVVGDKASVLAKSSAMTQATSMAHGFASVAGDKVKSAAAQAQTMAQKDVEAPKPTQHDEHDH